MGVMALTWEYGANGYITELNSSIIRAISEYFEGQVLQQSAMQNHIYFTLPGCTGTVCTAYCWHLRSTAEFVVRTS